MEKERIISGTFIGEFRNSLTELIRREGVHTYIPTYKHTHTGRHAGMQADRQPDGTSFEFEWRFYAQSASKAKARRCIGYYANVSTADIKTHHYK